MKVIDSPIPGIMVIEPKLFADARGYFFETYQQERYTKLGLPTFFQDNISHSKKNVLRGLHYQLPHAQGKLVGVLRGAVWDVVVDIRLSSPTFGKWFGIVLSAENHLQMYIPEGFAHGFCVISEEADFYYKCTSGYMPSAEHGIAWNDKELNISWPIEHPILSPKDKIYPSLQDIPHEQLFS